MTLIKDFLKKSTLPLIAVLGPTASGKTALSIEIAKKYNGEIISVDSRQIYQEMEIATDVISLEERQGILHHLLGITPPDKTITLAEFKDLALAKIAEIQARGKLPILAGGTGLYVSAIIECYNVPRIAPNMALRLELGELAKKEGSQALHEKLKQIDPQSAKLIHPNNLPYLIRALEINLVSGQPKTDQKSAKSPFDILMLAIQWPREQLYARVEERVDKQIERGLLQEVKQLLNKGYPTNLPSMSSLGIKEIIPYLTNQQSLEDCLIILKRNTRRYAKRQMTWLRRYDNLHWLSPEQIKNV